jgi:hypothetical protein
MRIEKRALRPVDILERFPNYRRLVHKRIVGDEREERSGCGGCRTLVTTTTTAAAAELFVIGTPVEYGEVRITEKRGERAGGERCGEREEARVGELGG